jgi:hypothetical protein
LSALSPRQMFLLDEACKPIAEVFAMPYLVGTAVSRQVYRDVDVRLILDDGEYGNLHKAVGRLGLAFLGIAIGEYLAARTGLPIDFQIQQQTAANYHHPEGMRNPLGCRTLGNYKGDAPPIEEPSSSNDSEVGQYEC